MSIAPSRDLQQVLEQSLGTSIASLRRRASNYATSHRIENLFLRLADGRSLQLVFKDLSPGALLDAARGVRPDLLQNPRREIEVYRRLLPARETIAPKLAGARSDEQAGQYWLLLRRLTARPLWEHGRFSTWMAAAAALGAFHRAGPPPVSVSRPAALLRCDRAFCRVWMERALRFRPSRRLEGLGRAHERAVDLLLDLPATFIHGECFASNVLVVRPGREIRLIDWESAAVGPGLLDLAALATGWAPDRRAALLDAYSASLGQRGSDMARSFACARLQVSVQMLGWSPGWRAPRAHRRDWLAEACSAARDAGL